MIRFIYVTSFLVSILLLGSMIGEKKTPLLRTIFWANLLVAVWLFGDTLPYFINQTETVYQVYHLKQLATILLIEIIYMFTLEYTGYFRRITIPRYSGLMVTGIVLSSYLTNRYPFPFIADLSVHYEGALPVFTYHPQLGFYIYVGYGIFTAVFCIALLVLKAIRSPKKFRIEAIQIIISLLMCLGGSATAIWVLMSSDLWKGDTNDVSSIFLLSLVLVIYIVTHRSPMTYEDRVMQIQMNDGLSNEEFQLVLQPQYAWQKDGYRIIGAEGLIRWVREGAYVSTPDIFIPAAERNEMILPLGNWVVDEIFRINRVLRSRDIHLKLSINVSCQQLASDVFLKHLEERWQRNREEGLGIDLVIELTESSVIENKNPIIERMYGIKRMGIELALDDFGTGYSSLSYLQQLPFDYLKVDKSFIDDITTNDSNLTKHILDMARTLKLKTVVEGTELKEQVDILKDQCDCFQGYYFSKPLMEEAFIGLFY